MKRVVLVSMVALSACFGCSTPSTSLMAQADPCGIPRIDWTWATEGYDSQTAIELAAGLEAAAKADADKIQAIDSGGMSGSLASDFIKIIRSDRARGAIVSQDVYERAIDYRQRVCTLIYALENGFLTTPEARANAENALIELASGFSLAAGREGPVEAGAPKQQTQAATPKAVIVEVGGSAKVSTNSSHASLSRGDWDVGSDDWTRVTMHYELRVIGRNVQAKFRYAVNEAQSDKRMKSGDTIIINERGWHTIWTLPKEYARIVSLKSKASGSNPGHWYRGKSHGWFSYPDVGAMTDITVSFDGGGDDKDHQGMRAFIDVLVLAELAP